MTAPVNAARPRRFVTRCRQQRDWLVDVGQGSGVFIDDTRNSRSEGRRRHGRWDAMMRRLAVPKLGRDSFQIMKELSNLRIYFFSIS